MVEVPLDKTFTGFLEAHLGPGPLKSYQLAGDASNRRYYRILLDQQSWVLMKWDPFTAQDYPFLSVQKHFKKNEIQVPEVIAYSESEGLVLLEDLGDLTLERKFWESQNEKSSLSFYKQAIDELLKIHFKSSLDKSDCTAFKIEFDVEKLFWEMNYGLENLIIGLLKYPLSSQRLSQVHSCFKDICTKLHQQKKYIAHRDYHSRNVMIKFNDIKVIDFQDARLGPIQYDLVSLLKDSYVNISPDFEKQLLSYYLERARPKLLNFSQEEFDYIYEVQTIQRCFKACGSFSSFYNQRQDIRYLKYISPTLKRVLKSLTDFPEYKDFADLLIDSGSIEKKYEQP